MGERLMEIPIEKQDDYALYANYCLGQVEFAPNYKTRILLRKMAAEWSNLADQARNEHTVVAASANGRANGHIEAGMMDRSRPSERSAPTLSR
jgi:hypothetical protein